MWIAVLSSHDAKLIRRLTLRTIVTLTPGFTDVDVTIFQALDNTMSYSFPRCPLNVHKIKKNCFTLQSANILKHTSHIWLPYGSVTSSAMMEKKTFSSSRLRVCSFLMYYVTTSITSFRMILDVYCAFFLPVSMYSRSVSSRLAIVSRTALKFPLLDDVFVRSSLWPRSGQFCFPQNTTVSIMFFRT